MKNIILLILVFAFAKAHAQNIQGVATYQTQRHVDIKMDSTSGMNDEIQKSIQEQLRKQFQKEYTLSFNDAAAIWKEEVALDKPQAPSTSGISIVLSGNSDILYQNIKDQTYTQQSDLMGKQFLVEDKLEKPEWKLEKETKNIGQYTCFKATLTEEVEERSFKSVNGEGEEEVKTVEKVTTAWYTLDIPVQHGPDDFWGLPGLILEVNDGKMAMMCTQVVINPKDGVALEIPTKGKKVSEAEYEKISEEKAKEMMERYQGGGRKKGEQSSFSIRIGG
ncbi:GLPGLI family protein [uncultured Dokdonia sp.]|uniref:GLPGLI family protein n=1 Tax=uncultured Dokdonia sp. TaxID=575653 RepID=UPI00261704F7|nr:GLPGLI family protein [uncultured Dokdonia sp.]